MNIYVVSQYEGRWSVYLVYPRPCVVASNLGDQPEAVELADEMASENRPSQVMQIHDDISVEMLREYN
jgi:hypothetical protein